ncbi:MAG: hypothetical protein H3Z53_04735 [archaeon]|nr:hypothetical protein [archaeon]
MNSEMNVELMIVEAIADAFEKLAQRLREISGAGKQAKTSLNIDMITATLPKELKARLTFIDNQEYIVIRPREYLGSQSFARLAELLKDNFDGEYVSSGKESHFRVKKG